MRTGFHFEEGAPLVTIEGQDIPVLLALMAAAIGVEIFLALKKDGRLGLVLPGLWLLRSAARLMVWMIQVSSYSTPAARAGELCMALLVESIPALLLLGVYALCRSCKRWKTARQLEQTRIKDL